METMGWEEEVIHSYRPYITKHGDDYILTRANCCIFLGQKIKFPHSEDVKKITEIILYYVLKTCDHIYNLQI